MKWNHTAAFIPQTGHERKDGVVFWGLGPWGESSLKSGVTEQTFNLLRGQGEGDQGPEKSKQKLITKMLFYITGTPDKSTI